MILNKSEQLLLFEAFKNGFKISKKNQEIILDQVDFYKAIGKLVKADLIRPFNKSSCRREKEYVLTDLGIVIASNLSGLKEPVIGYSIFVGIL